MGIQAIQAVDTTQVRNVPAQEGVQSYRYLLDEPIKDEVCFKGKQNEGKSNTFGKVVGWTLGAAALIAAASFGLTHGVKAGWIKGKKGLGKTIEDFLGKGVNDFEIINTNRCSSGRANEKAIGWSVKLPEGDKNIVRKAMWGLDRGICKGINWSTETAWPAIKKFLHIGKKATEDGAAGG